MRSSSASLKNTLGYLNMSTRNARTHRGRGLVAPPTPTSDRHGEFLGKELAVVASSGDVQKERLE